MTDQASNYYRASANASPLRPPLRGRRAARVCVIGGGFAGLNTALSLAERGTDGLVLLEARDLAFGASGRNGGFVFGGFSRSEAQLLAELGPEVARRHYRGTVDAVRLIRSRIDRYGIDCQPCDDGVIWANWFRDSEVLRRRQHLLAEQFEQHWQWLDAAALQAQIRSARYSEALWERTAFHMHPLNYSLGIAAVAERHGVAIHPESPATRLERAGAGWIVHTPDGAVEAEQVVLACGGYLAGLNQRVDGAVLPIATYIMVTEPLGARLDSAMTTRAAVYDTRFAFDYYRPLSDSRLLWGGRISVFDRSPVAVRRLLYRDMLKVFPQLDGVRIDYAWSGLMSYARHEMPQLGEIEPGLWLAQAFGVGGVIRFASSRGDLRGGLLDQARDWLTRLPRLLQFRQEGWRAVAQSSGLRYMH
ncbi:MAG: FAD-dependent oxidoreductase [Gammaproteobacteria bacterium HGW-Gammaproteobacteria-7]|nr:MAG: FAD-dependent oxidoreductase [Gammaproteobacteria bacterium HGW-Gammaproteobacteria-7]